MQAFARLFAALDQTNKTNEKVAAMAEYFRNCDPASAAWALYFLSGQRLQRLIPSSLLRTWAIEVARIDQWLFDECYEAVGDLGETISLIVPRPTRDETAETLAHWVEHRLLPLRTLTVIEQREAILTAWQSLDQVACLVFNKLLTGSFRVGVSQRLVVRALAHAVNLPAEVLEHRLMGQWQPTTEFYAGLIHPDDQDTQLSRPYPFFLAHALEQPPEQLGPIDQWQAEWKWDGIRAQIVRRSGQTFIWSRGEELVTDRFPELTQAAESLDDGTVLDGEIVGFKQRQVLPFAMLQRRIGRKQLGKKILSDVPVAFLAFDLLEKSGIDIREQALADRRLALEQLILQWSERFVSQPQFTNEDLFFTPAPESTADGSSSTASRTLSERTNKDLPFQIPEVVVANSWSDLVQQRRSSRLRRAEGLMLKRSSSPYRVGRPRGDWWKWKIEPYTIDAVLIYAQRGHGRRASLYTDYTFAVWDKEQLVPFAKAYSGLTDAEIRKVDSFVRKHTVERFGPVRSVEPQLVFELAFENIQLSTRHKSGIAVRFPRIVRWREDKAIQEADSIETIRSMIEANAHLKSES